MFKKAICLLLLLCMVFSLAACSKNEEDQSGENGSGLKDGVYLAKFSTDSSMFHVNSEHHDKGILTVENGKMTIHVTLSGTGILNLFQGTAEDAQKDGAVLLQPSNDLVTYEDGITETAFGFDIPVPVIDEEFDCALIGSKGKWYDHKVSVTEVTDIITPMNFTADVTLQGGTGRASVTSPADLTLGLDGHYYAVIEWSSPNYDFMMVNGTKYLPVNTEGNSVFVIPVELDKDLAVSADTTAMSQPHLIDYVLHFDGSSLK